MVSKFAIRIEHGIKKNIKISDGFFEKGSRITTSANRCVLFNILINKLYINFENLKCLDLCCGSGIVGFEMLSLGCKECTFLDCDKKKLKNINDSIKKYNFNATTVYGFLPTITINEKFDIIFLDPPYENNFCQQTVNEIFDKNILNKNGILIIETLNDIDVSKYKILDIKVLKNNAKFYFLQLI